MWDMAKKSLAFGIGAALLTGDKLRQFVDEAVERGEMSKEEANKFVDEVTNRSEEERSRLQSWIRDQVSKIMREVGAADASRLEALERRVQLLELRLAAEEESSADEVKEIV
jgi:polyhydroxyalkanoate synthesis regulator phasin